MAKGYFPTDWFIIAQQRAQAFEAFGKVQKMRACFELEV